MEPIEAVKVVVASHEDFVRQGDLDGMLENIADDIVTLAANAPLIAGKVAFREFYAALFSMGVWDFTHDYHGAEVVGDTVILHGVAIGTLTVRGTEPDSFTNNFLHVFRKQSDGRFRLWRAAFAPTGQADAD